MDFWRNKRVLITGSTGFVGSHLSSRLNNLGVQVFGLSKTGSGKSILRANITNFSKIDKFVEKQKIDICFHLAAESLVEAGQKNPYKTFKTNIDGALNILEIGRKYKFKKIRRKT